MREEEEDDDKPPRCSDQDFTLGIFSRKVPTYPPEDLTEEKGEKKDLEEDDVDDDDSEGGIPPRYL